MENALVLWETFPAFREELKKVLSSYNVVFCEKTDTGSIDAGTAEKTAIIFGNPKADFLKSCPNLKWVQLHSAGANGYIDGELKPDVKLSCASGCYGHTVSEHMVAFTFTLLRKFHLYRDGQNAGRWQSRGAVKSIQGAKIMLVGLGDIGSNYARRMKALGSFIIGIDRLDYSKADFVDEYFPPEKMEENLPRADVLALIVPGIKDNVSLIGRAQMAKMKKDAVIINCGRGNTVNIEDLCDALEAGTIGGAGLDVTDPEPLPAGHRLWKMENAVITPHVAGGRWLNETVQYILNLWLENARRFVRGDSLESAVDFVTGYKAQKA